VGVSIGVCSVLQCVAVYYCVLPRVYGRRAVGVIGAQGDNRVLQCSVLYCTAVCCSVL